MMMCVFGVDTPPAFFSVDIVVVFSFLVIKKQNEMMAECRKCRLQLNGYAEKIVFLKKFVACDLLL
jgi:hypothetical protein